MKAWMIGLNLVVSTFIGLAIGYWLDGVFSTRPWLTIIFLLLGIVSGFREIFRMVQKEDRGSDTKDL
ncbi:MAG: magnesium transporter [Thermodesulfovibrio sp.]|nr:magnesium transporter [Thermodesulfovibrio sp.]